MTAAALRVCPAQAKLLTRTGLDWSHRYSRTIGALQSLKAKSAYIDGELCALNSDGVPVFSRLQAAMDEGRTDQLVFFAFGDFPAYARLLASPRAKGIGGPYAQRAAWGKFCHGVACWDLFGHGALMMDLLATSECVGLVDISHGPLFPEKELGWLVYEGHEGQGYATEAAEALRNWAACELGLFGLVSYVDPENRRSIAVAERLGARLDPGAPKQDPGDLVYRHRAQHKPQ